MGSRGGEKIGFGMAMALFVVVFLQTSDQLLAINLDINNTRYRRSVSRLRLARIHKHLDKINKPSLLTIQSPDGDIIDCVHKRKQPAFDHPLLKNHKIQASMQRVPPAMPKAMERATINNESSTNIITSQGWHQTGQSCPKGTVPIRRTTVGDVLRAKSLYHFGKKRTVAKFDPQPARHRPPDIGSNTGHEHAIAYTRAPEEIYGAKATMNVWEPSIQVSSEFSLSQIWVLSGSFDGSDLNSIEAGWQVSPELYGDTRPRLFTYWTTDAYQATGCYNLLCSGFVQTNSRVAIGAAISPVSLVGGNQFDITILIWKDPKSENWWLGFGDNTLVGYWPSALFTHLADRATMVEWGGEIVNSRTNNEHTSTQMGSGHFADEGFGKASYFRNLEIVDSDNNLGSPEDITTLAENSNCYNIIRNSDNRVWGEYFYYGGPGRNPNCP
ncbi:uncharacterized protein LOC127245039 [Andrographis paniculata]|uniref:uncharacterized protein LOC127245039 n=1 Tax=Andrographis paniculata TaxID=175694 RepID=UPI0021E8B685|nr:uncharacterized protein LOC127245039 [Andrographis paniculata]